MDYTLSELVELLLCIPGIDNFSTRTTLLLDIPNNIKRGIDRDQSNPENDIALIVGQLAEMRLEKGKIALSIVLKNALKRSKKLDIIAQRLEEILLQISEKEALKTPLSSFSFRTHVFDLDNLIANCHGMILKKRGLVGFAIPCDYSAFETNFCGRLESELCKSGDKVKIKDPVSLDPKYNTQEDAIDQIKLFKLPLQRSYNHRVYNIICVVRVGNFNTVVLDGFWSRLGREFSYELANRLIIIMLGNPNCVFPQNTDNFFRLSSPEFKELDIHRFVRDIVNKLNWPPWVIDKWVELMKVECLRGDVIDIRYTYSCLDDHLQELQDALSKERFILKDFLLVLEQRSKDYVSASC
jgi:hypothetical protein